MPDESLYPVVTEPMILLWAPRMKYFSACHLQPQYTEQKHKMAIRNPLKSSGLQVADP